MHDDHDEYGFWGDDRDRSITGSIPLVRQLAERHHQHVPDREPWSRNPLWVRLGAIAALGVLAIPVAWMMRRDESSQERIAPVTTAAVPEVSIAPGAAPAPAMAPVSEPVAAVPAQAIAQTESFTRVAAAPATVESEPATTLGSTPAEEIAEVDQTVEVQRVCAVNYEIVPGDYWILVATKVGLSLREVLAANDATVATPLYPGRSICLPWNASPPSAPPPTNTRPVTATTSAPATTAAPPTTAAPATTVPPPKNTYTKAQAEQIIRDVWPDELEDEAVRIATRESNLTPTAHNYCCYGLFQIYYAANKASLSAWGITSAAQLYDPKINAYAAYAMYVRAGGWGPWQ